MARCSNQKVRFFYCFIMRFTETGLKSSLTVCAVCTLRPPPPIVPPLSLGLKLKWQYRPRAQPQNPNCFRSHVTTHLFICLRAKRRQITVPSRGTYSRKGRQTRIIQCSAQSIKRSECGTFSQNVIPPHKKSSITCRKPFLRKPRTSRKQLRTRQVWLVQACSRVGGGSTKTHCAKRRSRCA